MSHEFGRRDLVKLTAGAAIVAKTRAAGATKFFTADEYTLVDELTETIIPADEKSGGGRAARVALYIDDWLAEAFEQGQRDTWRQGLARVNALAAEMHGTAFLKCTQPQRVAVLTRMAGNEQNPATEDERFFREIKAATVRGYYTSRIGIHDDMGYLGNKMQPGDYAGELP
jgi:hypothetical protein